MKYEETLVHLLLLITIILIGISVTSCVNWTPVEYLDTPVTEPPLERVVLEQKAIENLNSEFDCFVGSSSDECADYHLDQYMEDKIEFELDFGLVELVEPVCDMDLCT